MPVLLRQRGAVLIVAATPESLGGFAPDQGQDYAPVGWPAEVAPASARGGPSGFTLVELLVALAVGAVLLMIAIPSFQNLTLSNRLTTTANDIVGAIATARMEAIKLNAVTQLCSNSATVNTSGTLGTKCGTETGAVYAQTGSVVTKVRAGTVGLTTPLELKGNLAALSFTSAGVGQLVGTATPWSGIVVDICTSSMASNNHRQVNIATGSIVSVTTTSGACP